MSTLEHTLRTLGEFREGRARRYEAAVKAMKELQGDQLVDLLEEGAAHLESLVAAQAPTPVPAAPVVANGKPRAAKSGTLPLMSDDEPERDSPADELSKNKRAILVALRDLARPASTKEIVDAAVAANLDIKPISLPAEIARLKLLKTGPLIVEVGKNAKGHPLYDFTPKGKQEVSAV